MSKGGLVFDFNGTLFWDSAYQELSWEMYLATHNISLTKEQKRNYIHGRNGKDTFEFLFKRKLSNEEVHQYTEEKEVLYRKECLKQTMELAPGAEQLLLYLKTNEVPIAIATASGKTNIDFFIDKFNLLDYFDEKNIIYNDGSVKGKPQPDIFEKAIEVLDVEKNESIIFEDSYAGIQAALNCKVASVIIVNSTNENYAGFKLPVITHFDQFDRNHLRLP